MPRCRGNKSAAGTAVDIWDCNNQANQQWALTSSGQLQTFNGSMCLDVVNNQTAPGTAVDIWTCNGQLNQKWSWGANGSLVSAQSGLCLDVAGAKTANGTAVDVWTCNGQTNQRWSTTTTTTPLVVDASSIVRSVTHVGNGFLYGLSSASTPPASIVAPLNPIEFRQPPPYTQHRPNGLPAPVGDTLVVAPTVKAVGSHLLVDMADSFDGFPYQWTSWPDWYARIDKMIAGVKSAGGDNVNAWEPWNEPDWTWPSATGVSFTDGWTNTVRRIKQDDSTAPILGPSPSLWDPTWMRNFLTAAKAAGTLPDIICWHELSGWQHVTGDVAAYRSLEASLGISPRPISIDEYATTGEIDVPSSVNHYIAQFERVGVHDAERAFWYEAGTLNGLLYNGQPTASYWMYRWYALQSGSMVNVTPAGSQDGVASYDSGTKTVNVVIAGQSGNNTVQIKGLTALGANAKVTMQYVPGSGRTTNVGGPTTLSTVTYPISGGSISVPISNEDANGAYDLVVQPG